jgi:hypothetical protein
MPIDIKTANTLAGKAECYEYMTNAAGERLKDQTVEYVKCE